MIAIPDQRNRLMQKLKAETHPTHSALDGQVPHTSQKAVSSQRSHPKRSAGIRAPFWRKQAGAREVRQALPEPVSSLPEQ
jgi:hypothetical protein